MNFVAENIALKHGEFSSSGAEPSYTQIQRLFELRCSRAERLPEALPLEYNHLQRQRESIEAILWSTTLPTDVTSESTFELKTRSELAKQE